MTQQSSTAVATLQPKPGALEQFNPFALMDQLDADAFTRQLEGIVSENAAALVYTVKEKGVERTALSKEGIDQACLALRQNSMVIREIDCDIKRIGTGVDEEAFFTARAAIFMFTADGKEVKLDEVVGVKREPLYRKRAPLTLDSPCPGKKHKGKSWRDVLTLDRDYIEWVSGNFSDEQTKIFARKILDGEAVEEFAAGSDFNPFWYEHGAMKALRNARFRLLPQQVVAATIAIAKEQKREKVVAVDGRRVEDSEHPNAPPAQQGGNAPEPKQEPRATPPGDVDFRNYKMMRGRPYWTDAERDAWDLKIDATAEDARAFRAIIEEMKAEGIRRKQATGTGEGGVPQRHPESHVSSASAENVRRETTTTADVRPVSPGTSSTGAAPVQEMSRGHDARVARDPSDDPDAAGKGSGAEPRERLQAAGQTGGEAVREVRGREGRDASPELSQKGSPARGVDVPPVSSGASQTSAGDVANPGTAIDQFKRGWRDELGGKPPALDGGEEIIPKPGDFDYVEPVDGDQPAGGQ